jgi:hypothetical protein
MTPNQESYKRQWKKKRKSKSKKKDRETHHAEERV